VHAAHTDLVLDVHLTALLSRGIEDGLVAAALVDRNGATVGLAGAIAADEAMPLAALVMYRLKSDDLAPRLFAGEIVSLALDDRDVAVGVAKRQLFVVAVVRDSSADQLELVRELRDRVARMLADIADVPSWRGDVGGSGSGPAELPLIEYGVTVRRERGKA
jgi:hypothetical protein